jgi:hypothetical protein
MREITHFAACLLSLSAQQDPPPIHFLRVTMHFIVLTHIDLVGRPAPAHDSSYGQDTRSDYGSYIPLEEELPRSRRSRRSRSASPRASRVRDTVVEEPARQNVAARRRPRDPETDVVPSEVETKRRRLDGLREPDRPLPSKYPTVEKNESLHEFPTGESRAYCKLKVPQAVFIDRLCPFVYLQAKNDRRYHRKRTCTRNQ